MSDEPAEVVGHYRGYSYKVIFTKAASGLLCAGSYILVHTKTQKTEGPFDSKGPYNTSAVARDAVRTEVHAEIDRMLARVRAAQVAAVRSNLAGGGTSNE